MKCIHCDYRYEDLNLCPDSFRRLSKKKKGKFKGNNKYGSFWSFYIPANRLAYINEHVSERKIPNVYGCPRCKELFLSCEKE